MKSGTYLIISLLLILITIAPGCLEEENEESFKEYSLKIETNFTHQYEIIIPIVENDNNAESKIISLIENEELKKVDTIKGEAFKLISNGNYSINKQLDTFEAGKLIFSMREIKNVDNKPKLFVWIYYNGTNSISLSMRCFTEQRGDISSTHEEKCEEVEISKIGWNQIELQSEGSGD